MPEGQCPKTWTWSSDGSPLDGAYVRITEGMTPEYGPKPILVLQVGNEERSLRIFETALREKLASELERRGEAEFEPGERIVVSRGEEKAVSEAGRVYWPVTAVFPDALHGTAASILGAAVRDDSSAGASHPSTVAVTDAAGEPPAPVDDSIPSSAGLLADPLQPHQKRSRRNDSLASEDPGRRRRPPG